MYISRAGVIELQDGSTVAYVASKKSKVTAQISGVAINFAISGDSTR